MILNCFWMQSYGFSDKQTLNKHEVYMQKIYFLIYIKTDRERDTNNEKGHPEGRPTYL